MRNRTVINILAIVLGCSVQWSANAQSGTLEVDKTYDFSPQKLSKKEKEKKMKSMDRFWNTVRLDTGVYLPLLRRELAASGHVPFFYFDGSRLLLYLSHSRSDKQIAANAIVKSDIKDIDQKDYVQTLNRLAFDSIDVVLAALKILDYPDFKFFLVEHYMYFNQENSLAYSLLPLPTNMYVDSLISRFPSADTTA